MGYGYRLSATKVSSESKDHNSNDHNSKTVKESKDDNSKTGQISRALRGFSKPVSINIGHVNM
eukprot:872045-Amorphochlora_amoeboformis.AAC.1